MAKTAFLGLGVMGAPMAGYLAKAGHEVSVFNRTAAKAEAWVGKHGGRFAASPRMAAQGADFVMICVGNDDDLRAVVLGQDGALAGLSAGAIIVDHTTASADVARELAEICAQKGVGFVDAPVSGGQAGAENGQLAIMCGGTQDDYAKADPIMAAYAKACSRFGDVGAGQITKMVNQICIASLVQGISEGIHFAEKAGLDAGAVAKLVAQGAGGSWQLTNRHETMIAGEFEHGFAVDWMRKDMGIALAQAKSMGVSLPMTALVDQFYSDVQAMGGGRWDTSSLIQRLRKLQGDI
ncbi:MAG: 3-hydroxyisobutyrate dehydrogenase [Dinoroseobacter sp.]|jgi:3-hydroxyisobutyrate dehydrogenase